MPYLCAINGLLMRLGTLLLFCSLKSTPRFVLYPNYNWYTILMSSPLLPLILRRGHVRTSWKSARCFMDVRLVFNPLAANCCSSLSSTFKKHENSKRRAYASKFVKLSMHASFADPSQLSAWHALAHEVTTPQASGFPFVY